VRGRISVDPWILSGGSDNFQRGLFFLFFLLLFFFLFLWRFKGISKRSFEVHLTIGSDSFLLSLIFFGGSSEDSRRIFLSFLSYLFIFLLVLLGWPPWPRGPSSFLYFIASISHRWWFTK